jgi:hypothetical protein
MARCTAGGGGLQSRGTGGSEPGGNLAMAGARCGAYSSLRAPTVKIRRVNRQPGRPEDWPSSDWAHASAQLNWLRTRSWAVGNAVTGGWLANNIPAAQAAVARNTGLGHSLLNLPDQLTRAPCVL